DPGMGVRPLEFFDGALELDDLESIEHCEGMVRCNRKCIGSNCGNARGAECFEDHGSFSRCSSPGVLRYSRDTSHSRKRTTGKRVIARADSQLWNCPNGVHGGWQIHGPRPIFFCSPQC